MNKFINIILILMLSLVLISCKGEEKILNISQATDEEESRELDRIQVESDSKELETSEEEIQEESAEENNRETESLQSKSEIEEPKENEIKGEIADTLPKESGTIMIGNIGEFDFDPSEIETIRDDIFNDGYFSIFDILVYLDNKNQVDMEYHFDETMNTYVIDSINSMKNWWYIAYYDGGWPERNVFRMDHYPYKDRMYISVSEFEKSQVDEYHRIFTAEINRKKNNGDKTIIPEVTIWTPNDGTLIFEDVEIKSHGLRSDIFKPDIITAIDAILSLGDEGKIKYGIKWYKTIGTAGVVKNYFVDRINNDSSQGRCGFVYEEGSKRFQGFQGNHIHMPSDTRVINSPEYLFFVYFCI